MPKYIEESLAFQKIQEEYMPGAAHLICQALTTVSAADVEPVVKTHCEYCTDMPDGSAIYTHSECDGGYIVEWHDAHYCFNCGKRLKE